MKKDLVPIEKKCCATCLYWYSNRKLIENEQGEKFYKILQIYCDNFCFNKVSKFYDLKVESNSLCEKYLSKYIFENLLNEK